MFHESDHVTNSLELPSGRVCISLEMSTLHPLLPSGWLSREGRSVERVDHVVRELKFSSGHLPLLEPWVSPSRWRVTGHLVPLPSFPKENRGSDSLPAEGWCAA